MGWVIHWLIILPELGRHRKIHFWDWIFRGSHQWKNFSDYKKVCIENNKSLTWYNTQIALIILFILSAILAIKVD